MGQVTAQDKEQASKEKQETQPRIRIEAQGALVVTGVLRLARRIRVKNAQGEPVAWQVGEDVKTEPGTFKLCRCGQSKTKPFCDDSHLTIDWDGALTADRGSIEDRQELMEGTGMILADDSSLCAGFAFCDRFGGVWDEINKTDDPAIREQLQKQIQLCPSGRLRYLLKRGEPPVEVRYDATVAVIPNGPIWALGGIPVEGPDGFVYQVRNRQLLCRCGHSSNKPFCDGTHWTIKFKAP